MKRKALCFATMLIASLLGFGVANASSLYFLPTDLVISVGQEFELEIWLDFSSEPVIGGGFDVAFDEDALNFISWTASGLGDPDFSREPDILPGLLSGIAVGDFVNPIGGPAKVGDLVFLLTAIPAEFPFIALQDTTSVAGPFVSAITFNTVYPVYGKPDISIAGPIPLPAGILLLLSAIATLTGLRRSSS